MTLIGISILNSVPYSGLERQLILPLCSSTTIWFGKFPLDLSLK
jgi:hypothetical protein